MSPQTTPGQIPAGGSIPMVDGNVAPPVQPDMSAIVLADGPGRGLCVGLLPPDMEPPMEWIYTAFLMPENRFAHFAYVRFAYSPASRIFRYHYSGHEVPTDPRNATADEDVTL